MRNRIKKHVRSTEHDNRRMISRAFAAGRWMMFPKIFLWIVPWDEALLLSFLCDMADKTKAETRKGWFYCTYETVETSLNINRNRQAKLFKSLIDKKIIKTERRGIPPLRHVKINWKKVDVLVEQAEESFEVSKIDVYDQDNFNGEE